MNLFTRFSLIVTLLFSSSSYSEESTDPRIFVAEQFNQLLADAKVTGYLDIPRLKPLVASLKTNSADSLLTPFIIGGDNAARNEFPEYALVLITDGRNNVVGFCGGSIIASNKILTAAHCAQERASKYYVLPRFYSLNDTVTSSSFYRGLQIVDHPNYNTSSVDYDLAVLTLSSQISGDYALVHKGSNKFTNNAGEVIGLGLTSTNPVVAPNILKKVDAPITSNLSCNNIWETLSGFRFITPRMMCAGFATDGRGSCSGDSGGPLFATIDEQRVIVGVVSFGYTQNCEINRATQGYARVSSMTDFILANSPETAFIESDGSISIAPIMDLLLED